MKKFPCPLKSKKALGLNIFAVMILAIFLTSLFIIISDKAARLKAGQGDEKDKGLGARQSKIFLLYSQGEKALFYTQQSAQLAAQQSVFDLAQAGGFYRTGCQRFNNYNFWTKEVPQNTNQLQFCFPMAQTNYASHLQLKLDDFLYAYLPANFFDNNYDFLIEQSRTGLNPLLTLYGFANRNVLFQEITNRQGRILDTPPEDYVKDVEDENIPDDILYLQGPGEEQEEEIEDLEGISLSSAELDLLRQIKNNYGQSILEQTKQLSPSPSESVIAALVMQESRGQAQVISPTGCAGLFQFCYRTSLDYSHIFSRLTRCDCWGSTCNLQQAACQPSNDDRFNPLKSIQAGTEHFSRLMRSFRSLSDQEKFALASYNIGQGVILRALTQLAEKGISDPGWEQVKAELTPELLSHFRVYQKYFPLLKDKQAKIREVINYVSRVSAYKQAYQQLPSSISSSSPAQSSVSSPLSSSPFPFSPLTAAAVSTPAGYQNLEADNYFYSLKPNFDVNLKYDLADYDEITELNQHFLECSNQLDREECIQQTQDSFNQDPANSLAVQEFCGSPVEKIFYSFVDQFQNCLDSLNQNCYCPLTLPQGIYQGTLQILVSQIKETRNIDGQQQEQSLLRFQLLQPQTGYISEQQTFGKNTLLGTAQEFTADLPDFDIEKSLNFTLIYLQGQPKFIVADQDDSWTADQLFLQHIQIGDNHLLAMIKPQYFSDPKQKYQQTFAQCLQQKKFFYFCADKRVPYHLLGYDKYSADYQFHSPTIKFALYLNDSAPPPAYSPDDLLVQDFKNAESSLLVKWPKSSANDTKNYTLYISPDGFSNLEEADELVAQGDALKRTFNFRLSEENIYGDIDLGDTQLDSGSLKFNLAKPFQAWHYQNLEKEKLYYFTAESSADQRPYYLYVVDGLEDGQLYHLALVPEDFFGNKDSEFQSVEVQPVDDLAPGPIIDISIAPTSVTSLTPPIISQVFVSGTPPAENVDGSELVDHIDHYCLFFSSAPLTAVNPGDCLRFDNLFSAVTLSPPQSLPLFFVVLALDQSNNPLNQGEIILSDYGFNYFPLTSLPSGAALTS